MIKGFFQMTNNSEAQFFMMSRYTRYTTSENPNVDC